MGYSTKMRPHPNIAFILFHLPPSKPTNIHTNTDADRHTGTYNSPSTAMNVQKMCNIVRRYYHAGKKKPLAGGVRKASCYVAEYTGFGSTKSPQIVVTWVCVSRAWGFRRERLTHVSYRMTVKRLCDFYMGICWKILATFSLPLKSSTSFDSHDTMPYYHRS